MYERRIESSLYGSIVEIQRLRLLRQMGGQNSEEDGRFRRTDYAKQTQFPRFQAENEDGDEKRSQTKPIHSD